MNFTRLRSSAGAGIAFVLAFRLLVINGLSAVTFYEDSMCSGVPSLIVFSPDSCQLPSDAANTSCQAYGNSFSVSSCPDDYTDFTSKAFGPNNPFMIEQAYYGWGCSAQYVNAGSANGVCHTNPVDNTSFRAGLNDQGRLVFMKFFDSACTSGHCATTLYKNEIFGWLTIGGFNGAPTGEHTAVALYEDNSCATPAVSVVFSNELSCTPQNDHYDPFCESNGTKSSISDCTQYHASGWDHVGVITDAFGNYPHLIVEKYVWCGYMDTITDVMVYRLDEKCYPNAAGNESHKLTLGRSVTITTYTDADCMNVATEITVDRSTILSGWCGKGDVKLFLADAQTAFSVVAIYEDSTCSGTPSQMTFTPTIWCDPRKYEDEPCQSVGGSLFSLSGCTNDYAVFATTAFGANNPFVIEEAFVRDCSNVGMVTMYLADGICHADLDGSTSFLVTLDTADTVVLRKFFDPACINGRNTATLTTDQLTLPLCMYESCENLARLCSVEDCQMWWWCSRKMYLGGLGGIPSMGRQTVVVVYGNDSCSAPAVLVTLSNKLTCTPQNNHYAPVCATDGTVYSVSDCTQYYPGGWDDIGIISDAFGDYPYLVVERYVSERCGIREAIMDVTVYRLDDNCYPNSAETASHRLMLGRSLTITTYADVNCTDVTSTSTVEQSMLTKSSSGNCVDNDKKFFVVNAQPVFTAFTIYEDNTCSGTPSQIIFSRDFGCHLPSDPENIPCQAFGNSLFSVSNCTNDYNNFTATAFGVTNAFVIEQASSSWCNRVESVTAYSADGVCHNNAVDYSSFRARIDSQGTLAFYKYYDSACTSNRDAATFYKSDLMAQSCRYYDCNLLPSLCSRQECNPWYYSCTRNISVGGLSGTPPTGKYAAVVEYEDNSCSAPAVSVSFTNELGCTSQTDHYDPVCVQDGTISDCTQYYAGGWDDIGVISEAFGNYPHLVVEKYLWCGMMDTVTDVRVYRLDEKCYPNAAGNESHKLTLGRSVTITTYTDADCMNVVTEIMVDRSTLLSSGCGAGDRKFLLVNAQSVFTTTAIYEDSKCSGTPSQISFIPAIGCHNVQDSANAPCEAIGNSLFSMSSCTNDYSTFAITVFGVDNPFVIEQGFSSSDCMNAGLITTYAADDNCHAKPNVYRSFRATLDAAGTLVFRTFYDPVCKNDQSTATLLKYQLISPMCMYDSCDVIPLLCSLESCNWWMCGRKLSIGGLDSANALNSAVLVFDDSSCAQVPVQIVVKKQLTCSKEASSCKAVSMAENALYQDHACIEDVATFAKAQFDSSSYLIMEKYRDGTNCEKQKVTVVYKADGLCYSSVDGTSFRVLSSFGESVTFASYPTASCNDDEAEVMAIGSKYINTGACYDGSMRLYGNLVALAPPDLPATCPTPSPTSTLPTPTPTTATTPTPAVNFDQKTREEIMFPEWLWEPTPRRVFVSA